MSYVERRINHRTGATTEILHFTDEELIAVDKAIRIIEDRAKAENVTYNKERTEWWLRGILHREGVGRILEMARTAPFQRVRTVRFRGYC